MDNLHASEQALSREPANSSVSDSVIGERVYHRSVQEYGLAVIAPRWTPDGLKADIRVIDGAHKKTLHQGELCLASLRDKDALARYLKNATALSSWHTEIGDLFAEVLQRERHSAKSVMLRDVKSPVDAAIIEVGGIPLLRHHPVVVFGDGETYKSMLGLWIAGQLAREGRNVLFADWELDAADHRARLAALFGDDQPSVRYLRCQMPILEMASQLRHLCQADAIDYLIVDSVAFAVGVPPETSEAAIRYYAALREIGIDGSLSIAHNTKKKPSKADRGSEKPFGSVFWHNGARMTWMAKPVLRKQQFASVQLDCRKSNLAQRPESRLIKLSFEKDLIRVTVGECSRDAWEKERGTETKEETSQPSCVRERIDELLRRAGPMTADEIKAKLPDVRADTIRMAISRGHYERLEGDLLWSSECLGSLEEWKISQVRPGS